MNSGNLDCSSNLSKYITETTKQKLYKTILSTESMEYGYFIEIINKISIDHNEIMNLLKTIMIKKEALNCKIPMLLYIIITKLSSRFLSNDLEGFNELEFVIAMYNNGLSKLKQEPKDKFYLRFLIIAFYTLKLNHKVDIQKLLDGLVSILSNEEDIKSFYHFYPYESMFDILNNDDIINSLISSFDKEKCKYYFDISKLSQFHFIITKSQYEPFTKQNEGSDPKFLFFPKQNSLLNDILNNLYHQTNSITKLLLYGPKSSGKTSFAKLLLINPLIIEVDESIETNYLLGGYLINEFSEIIWQDGILISALKEGKDILLLSMEKTGNDLLCVLKQLLEKNSVFALAKQEQISNFTSKIVMVFNTDKSGIDHNPLFNFLKSNSFSFGFDQYTLDDMLSICQWKYHLNTLCKDLLTNLVNEYISIPSKCRITSRFRKITLHDMLKAAKKIMEMIKLNSIGNDFISEKNQMGIVSQFIYDTLFTIDDLETLGEIANGYCERFNFSKDSFHNYLFNLEEKFTYDSNPFNSVYTFDSNEKIMFNAIPKGSFYSYNSSSKFYIKLINAFVLGKDNILLVGETGVGKTRMIQNLASLMNIKLNVINLSQSSDESDLFGGYKPVTMKHFLKKYFDEIIELLKRNFDMEKNKAFITSLCNTYGNKNEGVFVKFCIIALEKIMKKIEEGKSAQEDDNDNDDDDSKKAKKLLGELHKFQSHLNKRSNNAFKYIEGILLQAIKNDEWILLDEINLANDDMLLKLKSILEGDRIFLMNDNKISSYKPINKFRIFGSMNPEFNIGKKRLPTEVREFFSELFIREISSMKDIQNFVWEYLNDITAINSNHIDYISSFYKKIKELQASSQIFKADMSKCTFSLRTLTRTLVSIRNGIEIFKKVDDAIDEAIAMNFLSQIDFKSQKEHNISYTDFKLDIDGIINYSIDTNFILTPMFRSHIETLIRIVTLSDYAVLLEGPTSCGKTSIVEFLARCLKQPILRINNNQNTEVEEYLGTYTTDQNGNFYFNEGFLVKAVREGMWVILDEINLAPSEVLEALNRLLDDNRELYLPESNTVIKAHKNFRIFAAMNPSESYAGRKDLSDAFKNRFIHLFFDNIPHGELITIIEQRCKVPKSRAEIMVSIFSNLQMIRSKEQVFQRNEGFITIRDLIKWGMRDISTYDKLAIEGYILLAEKLRSNEEKETVRNVIEQNLKNKRIVIQADAIENYYKTYVNEKFWLDYSSSSKERLEKFLLTQSMIRILALVDKAINNHEAVLLIGDTGTGKTLAAEFLSEYYKKKLITVNCHENMDTNDFLGSLRSSTSSLSNQLFEWIDGPVTSSMKNGHMLLIDEISLVLDSVLERMNSIFEADSVLVLSEKNMNDTIEVIRPHKEFVVIATMSPSGEYGKKELSAALRARFTEIFIGDISKEDIEKVISFKVNSIMAKDHSQSEHYANILNEIYHFYNGLSKIQKPMTFRDVDIICEFISKMTKKNTTCTSNSRKVIEFFSQAIQMTIIEGLYLNETLTPEILHDIKTQLSNKFNLKLSSENISLTDTQTYFGVEDFLLYKTPIIGNSSQSEFVFDTQTLKSNLLKILRGMSIKKPILIEGSPGVGKTTIIQNIARKINKRIHRVNLSEHTDMIDLIGSQYPSSDGGFKWLDGVLLTAMKNGDWIIIDEMNLANQSILEGLNSVLDHRRNIFVPELNQEFLSHEDFQLFATQNPVNQGGGRKFLPKSFLNRFIKIYLDDLNSGDYKEILSKLFINKFKHEFITALVDFNEEVKIDVHKERISLNEIGEFNLRTMIKFLQCALKGYDLLTISNALYFGRIRRADLKQRLYALFTKMFNIDADISSAYDMTRYHSEIQMCIECNFPIIISGEGNCGKKELIRKFHKENNLRRHNDTTTITASNKKTINEFYLYSTMDSSELLGNFDKKNVFYNINQQKQIYYDKNVREINEFVSNIKSIEELNAYGNDLLSKTECDYNFEWHDSILVKSIINGEWIILDNVNTCSSAVLDRLNSLLDDDKTIYLNESGEGRVICPSKSFRIFLIMNQTLGEVSRALKNRCVELHYGGKSISYESIASSHNDAVLLNNFSIDGNYKNLTVLYGSKKITIETGLFNDLIALSKMPFWISFHYLMSFMFTCSFNFQSYKQFLGLCDYFVLRTQRNGNDNESNKVVVGISKAIQVINYSSTSEVVDNEDSIQMLYNQIDHYFFKHNDLLSPIQLELYQRYHFNAVIEHEDIVSFYTRLACQSRNVDLIASNEKNMFNLLHSSSPLFAMIKDLKTVKQIVPLLRSLLNYFVLHSYQIPFVYSLHKRNIEEFKNDVYREIDYPYAKITYENIKDYIQTNKRFDSCMNQLKKLIQFTLEHEVNIIKKSILAFDDLELFYVLNDFISKVCSNNEHIAFIRYNSDIFVFLIKMLIDKCSLAFNKNISINTIQPYKSKRLQYTFTQESFDKYSKMYLTSKHFTIDKDILGMFLNFSLKSVHFKNEAMNEVFLKKLFCDTNSDLTSNTNDISLIPIITQKTDFANIQQLIEVLNQAKSFINTNELCLIEALLSTPTSIDSVIEKILMLNGSNSSFASKLFEKNFFIWTFNMILNAKNEWYYPLAIELIRLVIIDQYHHMLKEKLKSLSQNNEIECALNGLLKNKTLAFYAYPFIYFYTKLSYENIENNLARIRKILSCDLYGLLKEAIGRVEELCGIQLDSKKNEEDVMMNDNDDDKGKGKIERLLSIANELRKKVSPSKESIYKAIGKPFKKIFNETKMDCYAKLSFVYQFLNKKGNDQYEKIITKLQEKLDKYTKDSFYSNNHQIFQYFIKDIDGIDTNLNKVSLEKFINDYLLYFTDLILPKSLIEFIIIMLNQLKTTQSKSLTNNHNMLSFNPTCNREVIIARLNMFTSFEMKIEYLMRIATEFNKDIIISIYQELHHADEKEKEHEMNNISDMKAISQRIKKYVSLEEMIMANTAVIGEFTKEEKEAKEKEEELKEINEKFPQYENQFDIFTKPTLLPQSIVEEPKTKIEQATQISANHHIQIFNFLCNIYSISTDIHQQNLTISNNDWYSHIESSSGQSDTIMSFLHSKFNFFKSNALFNDYEGNLYQASTLAENDTNSTSGVNIKSTNNFYLEANPSQMKILYIPLNTLVSKCSVYLSQFEDHPVLASIVFMANSLLTLDMNSTPLAKLLSGLDILLNKLHEWDAYSSKHINSLQQEIEFIMRVIRHYRKIEVLSWKNFLLTKQQELLKKDIGETFYDLFRNRNQLMSDIDFLNYFVMTSSMGNFSYRLNLLRVFASMTECTEERNVLNNIYQYYNINYVLSKRFDKFKEEKIGEIEEKIRSLTKIAKWDIKNYLNFRDNMKRNYKQLNKLLKGNENIFSTYKLSDIIQLSKNEYGEKMYLFDKLASSLSDDEKTKKNQGEGNEEEEEEESLNEDNSDVIYDEFYHEIINRIKTLKTLNMSKQSSTKAFKNKALLDLIKKLQSLGLCKEYKFLQNEIFEKFKLLSLTQNTQSAYICKILEKINNFSNLTTYSSDLNINYFDRMKGLAFSFFDKCLRIYINMQKLKEKLATMIKLKYIHITKEKETMVQFTYGNHIKNFMGNLKEFLSEINIKEIDNVYKDKTAYNKQFEAQFNEIKRLYANMTSFIDINSDSFIKGEVSIIDHNYLINLLLKLHKNLQNILSSIETNYPVISYQYSPKGTIILLSLSSLHKTINATNQSPSHNPIVNYDDFMKEYITSYEATLPQSQEETNHIRTFNSFYIRSMTDDNYDEESPMFSFENIITLLNSFDSSLTMTHLLTKISLITMDEMDTVFISILKLANLSVSIFYNVTLNGFCKNDAVETKEGEASGVQEGGMGMADAEGVEDITKQIEDEEQLLGLKDERQQNEADRKDNRKEKGDEEKEDNAFEMKTDFKENERREMDKNEDEDKKKDDEDIEREEGSVGNEDDNQMYNEDNSLNDEDEKEKDKDEKKEKNELDLTDKNIQTKGRKDDELKAKDDNDKRKDNEKNVDNEEEEDDQNKNDDGDKDNDNDDNKDEKNKEKKEKKKVEKIEVDKDDKKDGEDDDEEEEQGNEDEQMEVDGEEQEEEGQKDNKEEEPDQDRDDNLLPDNSNEMEIDDDQQQNEENNSGNDDEVSSSNDHNADGKDIEMLSENQEEDKQDNELDTKIKSNPVQTNEKDLGYNPLTSNEGNGGNTAQQTKEQLSKAEEDKNTDPNLDELKDLEQFKEIFDINSILDSVWTSRPNMQKKPKNQQSIIQNNNNEAKPNEEDNKTKEEPIEDFKYENYNEKPDNDKQEQPQQNEADYNQGYTTEVNDDILKKAKGNAKESQPMNKKNQPPEQKKEKDDNDKQRRAENDNNANEEIELYENDKNAEIVNNNDHKEDNDKDEQMSIDEEKDQDDNESHKKEEENDKEMIPLKQDDNKAKGKLIISTEQPVMDLDEDEEDYDENEDGLVANPQALSNTIQTFNEWLKSQTKQDPHQLLSQIESLSHAQILKLTELLKIALEPNKQTKLKGNFKTGKRLNMKRIISFIASNYRQDKIWLRRTLPFERDYLITIAIDDSLSMKEHDLGFFAMQSLVILSSALRKLSIGKVSVCSIKDQMHLLNSFDDQLSQEKLSYILSQFKFDFSSSNSHDFAMMNFMSQSIKTLESVSVFHSNVNQIVFIFSDGRFNKKNCKALCNQAREKGLLYIFVILDQYGLESKNSILNTMSVDIDDMSVKPYLEDFPFQYYVVVQEPGDLPEVVQTILLKWFSIMN